MTPPRAGRRRPTPGDDAVAWELVAVAHPHLSRVEADRIYIAIGIGERFDAIDALLTAIARNRIPLGQDLLATVASWLDCYRGQDSEPRLRHLLAEITSVSWQRMSVFERRFRPGAAWGSYRRSR